MITVDNTPKNYKPYSHLTICTNKISNYTNLFVINDNIPLLIGCGDKPMIWIQGAVKNKSALFIDSTISKSNQIKITEEDGVITIIFSFKKNYQTSNVILLKIKQIKEDEATVSQLDLRPIGLNIYGNDSDGLTAGNIKLFRSTINATTAITFSDKKV